MKAQSAIPVAELLRYADVPVRLLLRDGNVHTGRLRTELLSERSISVFIARGPGDGETIYIDDVVSLEPLEPVA